MTERNQGPEPDDPDGATTDGDDAVAETAGTPSSSVRDVVGRRGYDEGEDETAEEDEEH